MSRTSKRWWIAVAAIAVIVTATTGVVDILSESVLLLRTKIAFRKIIDAAGPARLPAARFTAIPTIGTSQTSRSAMQSDLSLQASTGFVIAISSSSHSPNAIAATAAALVVERKTAQAVALLEAEAARANDARLWSDLAAAYLELDDAEHVEHLLRALVASDKALGINSRLVSALYNRALVLDRLGLRAPARDAWQDCLDASPDPQLATSVRARLSKAEVISEADRWKAREKKILGAAVSDSVLADRIVAEFPRLARASTETFYLTHWAEAYKKDDARSAAHWLQSSRIIGDALRRRGDTLVSEAITAIDAAIENGDTHALGELADAHLAYFAGRVAYGRRDYANAEKQLRRAAVGFNANASVMARVARQYTASVLIDATRIHEATDILEALIRDETPPAGHRALLAGTKYLLAICEMFRGRWNGAVDAARESAEIYREIGDPFDAASSESERADILDLVGHCEEGWIYRVKAFQAISDTGILNRLLVAIGSATRAAMRGHDRDLALS
ncbi:MAG TPA: tetratricopeptide repeat protein, partial [Thermoanaerobaculia bacterium]|nr:tetratricopeptide repeat protein [Thermoanaerobaculia bacterium]